MVYEITTLLSSVKICIASTVKLRRLLHYLYEELKKNTTQFCCWSDTLHLQNTIMDSSFFACVMNRTCSN
jgi:hypothetical protein